MMQTLHWRSQIRLRSRVAWAQGEREAALDEIEQAVALANQSNTLQLVRDACAQQARFWLKSNRPALANAGPRAATLIRTCPPSTSGRSST